MFSSLNISWLCKHGAAACQIHSRRSIYRVFCPGQRSLAGSLEVGKQIKAILALPLSLLEITTTQGQL